MSEYRKRQAKINVLHSKEEFDVVLNQGAQIKNSFFVLHFCNKNLSTKTNQTSDVFVDKFLFTEIKLGLIIPKRMAKRAVTRSLIKRQCRAQFCCFMQQLPQGNWVLRLKRPIDTEEWQSASSESLKAFIRLELQSLFLKAIKQFALSSDGD